MKWMLRRKLKKIHQQLELTLIYVTHDQVEALTFADAGGRDVRRPVVQMGAPEELFETPAHTFVGYFIGSPGMNLLPGRLDGDAMADRRACVMPLTAAAAPSCAGAARAEAGHPPRIPRASPAPQPGAIAGDDRARCEDLGNHKIVTARLGGTR